MNSILSMLRSGGALKFSTRNERFFLVQHSRDYHADQAEAMRLLRRGAVRPHGQDNKGQLVFALNERALQGGAA